VLDPEEAAAVAEQFGVAAEQGFCPALRARSACRRGGHIRENGIDVSAKDARRKHLCPETLGVTSGPTSP
jgi:hypothetical protein